MHISVSSAKISHIVSDNIKKEFEEDGIIKIICNKVLHIANNIRLLFHLRKFDFYHPYKGM